MKFAARSMGGGNGQAAWAVVYGLLKVLQAKDILSDDDVRQVITESQRVAPSQNSDRDVETKEMLAEMGKSV